MNDFVDDRTEYYKKEAEKLAIGDWMAKEKREWVNHPQHYNQIEGIECIDVIENFNYNIGAVIKHLWRAGLKGEAMEDLRKAQWYLNREIERRERDTGAD